MKHATPRPGVYYGWLIVATTLVIRHHFRLGVCDLRKLGFLYQCNTLVILLPRALEERLIGSLLDQGMLKDIPGLRRQATLIHDLGIRELCQPVL